MVRSLEASDSQLGTCTRSGKAALWFTGRCEGALKAIAQPIPDREPWEVGFGFVSDAVARGYLLNLTPSRFVRTIDPEHEHNRPGYILTDLRRLDDEFGPLWDSSQLSLLHTCFHDCIRLKIAKVM